MKITIFFLVMHYSKINDTRACLVPNGLQISAAMPPRPAGAPEEGPRSGPKQVGISDKLYWYSTSVSNDTEKDRIFQTTNIMYTLNNQEYDAHDIFCLSKSGVNIFNVDRTISDEDYFQKIKTAIVDSEELPEIYPKTIKRPVGLAITINIGNFYNIDERVDIIIIKEVNDLGKLLEFKKQNNNISIPIILWITTWNLPDLKQTIRFSDGVILDFSHKTCKEELDCQCIELIKEVSKPVFYVINNLIRDYKPMPLDDRKNLAIGSKIVKYQFDGVVLIDDLSEVRNTYELVRSLANAIDIAENVTTTKTDYYEYSFKVKTPVLPPISAALAACLAAKQSEAAAIIILTSSGATARLVANTAPPCHMLAVTSRKTTARRLHLYRKVIPLLYEEDHVEDWATDCWNRVQFATSVALLTCLSHVGAKVVILAPSNENIGYCNSVQIISLKVKCNDFQII